MRHVLYFLGALVAASLVVVPPASADGEIVATMPNGVLYDSCGYYSYNLSAYPPFGFDDWQIDLYLYGPDGNEIDSDYVYSGSTSDQKFFICESPNLPGRCRITGEGKACNDDYDCVSISASPSSPKLRLPRTKTSLKVKPRSPKKDGVVRFIVTSRDERPAGYFATSYADVLLQTRVNGKWKSAKQGKRSTDSQGRVVFKYRFNVDRARVRAKTLPDGDYTGSKSQAITVKAR